MNRVDLIAEVSAFLNDNNNVRWGVSFHEASLQGGLREIAKLKPSAFTVVEPLKLDPGNRQHLPAGGELLVEVRRNMGEDGATPGRAIRKVSYNLLRSLAPGWGEVEAGDGIIDDYAFDIREPRSFLVFPAAPAVPEIHVEVSFVRAPEEGTTNIPVSDLELEAVRDWMLYRAYQVDTGIGSAQKANTHLQAFMLGVTGSTESVAMTAPDRAGGQ